MTKKSNSKQAICYFISLGCFLFLSACSEKTTVQFAASEQTVAKAAPGGSIQVNLKRSSKRTLGLPFVPTSHVTSEVLVPYTVSGTAQSGVIHNLSNGTLRIPAGAGGQPISFQILDGSFQGSKTIVVQLNAPSEGQLGEKTTHTVYLGDGEISGYITINNGDLTTQSQSVTLTFSASGVNQMYVTNIAGCGSGGSWEAYSTTKNWTLAQSNSLATVYVKFRDAALNETDCYSDDITHETFNPVTAGAVVIDGGDRDYHGHVSPGADGITGTSDDVHHDGWLFVEQIVNFALAGNLNNAPTDMLVVGSSHPCVQSITAKFGLSNQYSGGTDLQSINLNNYKILYVPGSTFGTYSPADLQTLIDRKTDIQNFVNSGGSLVAFAEWGGHASLAFQWLELPLPFVVTQLGIVQEHLSKTQAAIDAGFTISDSDLSAGTPYHLAFSGPPDFNGLVPFVTDASNRVITLGFSSLLRKNVIMKPERKH